MRCQMNHVRDGYFHRTAGLLILKKRSTRYLKKYLKYEQFPGYNYWTVVTDGRDWFCASRFHMGKTTQSAARWSDSNKDLKRNMED